MVRHHSFLNKQNQIFVERSNTMGSTQSNDVTTRIQETLNSNSFSSLTAIETPATTQEKDILASGDEHETVCRICEYHLARYTSMPCKHRWICITCTENFDTLGIITCPICSQQITMIV